MVLPKQEQPKKRKQTEYVLIMFGLTFDYKWDQNRNLKPASRKLLVYSKWFWHYSKMLKRFKRFSTIYPTSALDKDYVKVSQTNNNFG